MNYCKYHPLGAATYYCPQCQIYTCDDCTNKDRQEDGYCFLCQQVSSSLGSASSEEPFWRRLDQSFKYPLNLHALVLIIGVSILSNVVAFVPFTIVWQLMLTGAMMSYCFACLQQTAIGKFKAPDITSAYAGGLSILAKLFAIFLIMILGVGLIYYLLGPVPGNLAGVIVIVFIPAAIILFGLSNSMIEALNPLSQLRLITAVGLPYGLILAFVLVMTASVGIINELIGSRFGVVSSMLEATVANYYTVVLFHIMGYMIFQYQDRLGFTARADHGEGERVRGDAEKTRSFIDILVKEGEFQLALKEMKSGVKNFPGDPYFTNQCFEFILASRDTKAIDDYGSYYLENLIRRQDIDQLNTAYKRILLIKRDFQANIADVRYRLAQVLRQFGDSKTAVKVLNHLHKDFPDYTQLPAAYELMAECLEELPNMQKKARQYHQFAGKLGEQLKQKQAEPTTPGVIQQQEPGVKQQQEQEPRDLQNEQLKPVHSIVDQELVDSLSLVPKEEQQAEGIQQYESGPDSVDQEAVGGLGLTPIDGQPG
jgi:tetratricopeptide (TPR) repeat protein